MTVVLGKKENMKDVDNSNYYANVFIIFLWNQIYRLLRYFIAFTILFILYRALKQVQILVWNSCTIYIFVNVIYFLLTKLFVILQRLVSLSWLIPDHQQTLSLCVCVCMVYGFLDFSIYIYYSLNRTIENDAEKIYTNKQKAV